jgi:phosphoglucosamine mutase
MTLRFGTDGVRGHANELTDDLVLALGRAAARVLAPNLATSGDRFVIGRDPRASGPRIEAALVAGLAAEGVPTELIGVAPTPAVAWIAAARDVPAAMISASHNAFHDNGIKFFAAGGRKLSDEVEGELEATLDRLRDDEPASTPTVLAPVPGGGDVERYELAIAASIEHRALDGLQVVIDCANGAASTVAPRVLDRLGVDLTVLHAAPNGRNINDGCGSTHPADLAAEVVVREAAIGLAFDGDADRVLAVDETGSVVDGDHLIALCAVDLRDRGRLHHDAVVVTVMTNLGFRLAMAERGIEVVETAVGDRYVLEALARGGYSLGGEQSGHVIFHDLATTGDGLLTGLQVLDLLRRSGQPFSKLASEVMTTVPQVLRNVAVGRVDPTRLEAIRPDVDEVAASLGDRGRVLVRPSGTEPLVRVMVEALDADEADAAAARLVQAVEQAFAD